MLLQCSSIDLWTDENLLRVAGCALLLLLFDTACLQVARLFIAHSSPARRSFRTLECLLARWACGDDLMDHRSMGRTARHS
jgi:hypothetical protein